VIILLVALLGKIISPNIDDNASNPAVRTPIPAVEPPKKPEPEKTVTQEKESVKEPAKTEKKEMSVQTKENPVESKPEEASLPIKKKTPLPKTASAPRSDPVREALASSERFSMNGKVSIRFRDAQALLDLMNAHMIRVFSCSRNLDVLYAIIRDEREKTQVIEIGSGCAETAAERGLKQISYPIPEMLKAMAVSNSTGKNFDWFVKLDHSIESAIAGVTQKLGKQAAAAAILIERDGSTAVLPARPPARRM